MEENRMKTTLEKIEKLIVDGQREVLTKIGNLDDRQGRLEDGFIRLEAGQQRLEEKIDTVHVSLKKEIVSTAKVLDYDIKEIGRKLDEHVSQSAFGG